MVSLSLSQTSCFADSVVGGQFSRGFFGIAVWSFFEDLGHFDEHSLVFVAMERLGMPFRVDMLCEGAILRGSHRSNQDI